ncbi:MAG: DUF211 domain-containing protein [Proteobacteria bacterium]|nr:DUF211 domain-containing protein [Pseudomonadota bacterium]
MKIRRLVLDVDKAMARPSLIEIARAIQSIPNVEGVNVTVNSIDIETVGTEVTIEGKDLDYEAIVKEIESTGAVVHSIDQIASGDRIIENVERRRS